MAIVIVRIKVKKLTIMYTNANPSKFNSLK